MNQVSVCSISSRNHLLNPKLKKKKKLSPTIINPKAKSNQKKRKKIIMCPPRNHLKHKSMNLWPWDSLDKSALLPLELLSETQIEL